MARSYKRDSKGRFAGGGGSGGGGKGKKTPPAGVQRLRRNLARTSDNLASLAKMRNGRTLTGAAALKAKKTMRSADTNRRAAEFYAKQASKGSGSARRQKPLSDSVRRQVADISKNFSQGLARESRRARWERS